MRRRDDDETPRPGTFTLRPGEDFFGQLTLKGGQSLLYLRDESYVSAHNIPEQCIKGVLHDLTRITLLHCIPRSTAGSAGRGNERYSFAEIFPHFVLSGDQHIGPSDKAITAIDFVIDDATTLFYDFDAFGHLIVDAKKFIEEIVHAQAKELDREISVGPEPEIFYFTGKRQIFSAETALAVR